MTITEEKLRINDLLFFKALNKKTYKKMSDKQIKKFLRISLLLTGIFAVIKGLYLSAFRSLALNPGSYAGSSPNRVFLPNPLIYDILKGIEYGILEVVILLILYFIYKNIDRDYPKRTSSIEFDIALLAQLAIVKDCLYIIYSLFVRNQAAPIFNYRWDAMSYYSNAANVYDIGLFLPFMFILIMFFIPRLVTMDKQDPDYSKQIFTAFFLSMVIYSISSFVHSVIKVLIDMPLGLI